MNYLHFNLGPVQGFVSQARRTRDFWAGSFLLSWLTARAMKAVQDAGGEIVMPFVKGDELLARVCTDKEEGPTVGSLPNNFIAKIDEGVDGDIAVQAVKQAWKALADKVWEENALKHAGVNRDLWESQIEGFWDMAWVVSDSDDGAVLVQRKNWRSYMPPATKGDKCTMMGEWQELSGAEKPNPKQQAKFWSIINKDKGLDLRENERLCAIAYVKRQFVHVWQHLEGHQGWKLPTSVPSTSYMAAVHWLENAIEYGEEPHLKSFHDAAKSAVNGYGEWSTKIKCIEDKAGKKGLAFRFASLDGRVFFQSALENSKEFKSEKAKLVLNALHDLTQIKVLNKRELGHPSPFYAILMMDGDNLGETKAAMGDATALSAALGDFTKSVPDVVKNHSGFLIYAGGDDVLAILPLEDALPCAAAVRRVYMDIFAGREVEAGTYSISAAIEYAHMKLPLTMILKDAHKLLDEVAKDQTGRDAVACRVWKPGGVQQTWAMPWNEALEDREAKIASLATKLGENEEANPGYASKFLYNIRETLEILEGGSQLSSQAIRDMLIADYMSSGLLEGIKGVAAKQQHARKLIEPLLYQCRVFKNKQDTGKYSANGALLLRFLAQKGVER